MWYADPEPHGNRPGRARRPLILAVIAGSAILQYVLVGPQPAPARPLTPALGVPAPPPAGLTHSPHRPTPALRATTRPAAPVPAGGGR